MSIIRFQLISGGFYQSNTEDCKNDEDINELLSETERITKKINNQIQRTAMQTGFRITSQGSVQQG